jgi:hypothetical protein
MRYPDGREIGCAKCGNMERALGQCCDGPLLCLPCMGWTEDVERDRMMMDTTGASNEARYERSAEGQAWAQQERDEAFARRHEC